MFVDWFLKVERCGKNSLKKEHKINTLTPGCATADPGLQSRYPIQGTAKRRRGLQKKRKRFLKLMLGGNCGGIGLGLQKTCRICALIRIEIVRSWGFPMSTFVNKPES